MKKVFSVFLVFTLIAQTFVNVGIGVYYHLNKVYIAQQLCENKDNPKSGCNGHCYLTKQLKKAEEGEKKSARIIKEKEEIISTRIASLPIQYIPNYTSTKIRLHDFAVYNSGNKHSLLKPPTV